MKHEKITTKQILEEMNSPNFQSVMSQDEVKLTINTYPNNREKWAELERDERLKKARAAAARVKRKIHDVKPTSSSLNSGSSTPSLTSLGSDSSPTPLTFLGPSDKSITKMADPSMDVDGYQYPKKTVKLQTHENSSPPTVTANSFHMLDPETSDASNKQSDHINSKSDRPPSEPKPPAIFIYDITDRYTFSKTQASTCSDRLVIKHTSDYFKFQTTKLDFDKIQTYCLQQKLQFATENKKTKWSIANCQLKLH